MFEWILGAVIGIILLGFVGWIPAFIGYFIGSLGGAAIYREPGTDDIVDSMGFCCSLVSVISCLPIFIWLGHEIVVRFL